MNVVPISELRAKSDAQFNAGNPSQNVWVAASAGSGKTSVLVDRLLRLLLAGVAPHRLLCLTFTKAAAAEMSDRLFRELGRWVVQSDQDLIATLEETTGASVDETQRDLARRLFARVLETPGGLRIQTIHGFCESLLARFPLEAGQPPNFDVLDERQASGLLAFARDEILLEANNQEGLNRALKTISSRIGELRFLDVVNRLAGERGRIDRLISRHGGIEKLVAATFLALDVDQDDTERKVISTACDGGFNEPGLRAAADVLLQGSKTDVVRGDILAAWLQSPLEDRVDGFDTYTSAYLTNDGSVRQKLITKASQARMPDSEDVL